MTACHRFGRPSRLVNYCVARALCSIRGRKTAVARKCSLQGCDLRGCMIDLASRREQLDHPRNEAAPTRLRPEVLSAFGPRVLCTRSGVPGVLPATPETAEQ